MDNKKPKRKNKLGAGRPFKMKIWVEALKKVIDERKVAFLTQTELVFLVNKEIEDKNCHITERTLRNWASGKTDPKDDEVADEFLDLYKTALIEQKLAIVDNIMAGNDKLWYRFGWLAERVFSEQFNLKQITEVKHTSNQPIIQIQASNDEQIKLIDNIINGDSRETIDADFEIVEPIKLQVKNDNEKKEEYDF